MNRQFRNERPSLTVADKQAGVGKLFDWSHVQYKTRGKDLQNESRLKYSGQKSDRGGGYIVPIPLLRDR